MMKSWVKTGVLAVMMAAMMLFPSYAGEWRWEQSGGKWWYQEDSGSFPTGKWKWIDGNRDGVAECYCFDEYGYLYTSATTPDGYQVNEGGAWVMNGTVPTISVFPGSIQDCMGQGGQSSQGQDIQLGEMYVPDESAIAEFLIELVNKERENRGLSALERNEELMENASVRAEEVGESFSHIRPDGRSYSSAITAENKKNGENIMSASAFESDRRTAEYLMELWMDSVSHRKNLLDFDFEETGVGVKVTSSVWDGCTVYSLTASQLFIR